MLQQGAGVYGGHHLLEHTRQQQGADFAVGFLQHAQAVGGVQCQFVLVQLVVRQVSEPSGLLEALMKPAAWVCTLAPAEP
eukprot:1067817-Amphidinium_carterae.1